MVDPVVEVARVTSASVPGNLRVGENLVVEVDVMSRGFACSASLSGAVASGDGPIGNLFSRPQLALVKHQTSGDLDLDLDLDELSPLGPIFVLELTFPPDGFARPLAAEMWLYPDGSRTIELSTRCVPAEAFEVAAAARAFLHERGVELDAFQHRNLRSALEFFSDERSLSR